MIKLFGGVAQFFIETFGYARIVVFVGHRCVYLEIIAFIAFVNGFSLDVCSIGATNSPSPRFTANIQPLFRDGDGPSKVKIARSFSSVSSRYIHS